MCQVKNAEENTKFHQLEQRIDFLIQMTTNLEKNLMAKVDARIKEKIEEGIEEKMKEMELKLTKKFERQKEESDEKEKRKENIILVNIPESTKEKSEDREKDDMDSVRNLLSKIEEIHEGDLSKPIRIGKRTSEKPRIIKLKVKTEEMKERIVKNARKLNQGITSPDKKVYINNDLTPLEREKERKEREQLRQELKERQDKGETGLRIRGKKIVQVDENGSEVRAGRR